MDIPGKPNNSNGNSNGHSNGHGNGSAPETSPILETFETDIEKEVLSDTGVTSELKGISKNPDAFSRRIELYKRLGFYSAFNEEPKKEFGRMLLRLEETFGKRMESLEKEYDNDIDRFRARKIEASDKVKTVRGELEIYKNELPDLEEELPKRKQELSTIKSALKTTLIEIGNKKESLIEDRQTELRNELNRINEELAEVVKKRMNINEEIFENQKEILQEKRTFWQDLFTVYSESHRETENRLNLYGLPGNHLLSSNFLSKSGFVTAYVAGAFFASFAEQNQFASGGVISFIIQSLFRFSMDFFNQGIGMSVPPTTERFVLAGVLLVIFLVLIALIFFASWACQAVYSAVYEKKSPVEPDSKEENKNAANEAEYNTYIELSFEGKDIPINSKISEKTFLGFWLKITPILVCMAIMFVLTSLGTDMRNLSNLYASISGFGIGLFLALGAAGMLYLYVILIIEPRIAQKVESSGEKIAWFAINIELGLTLLGFVIAVLIVLFVVSYPFNSISQLKALSALLLFLVCVLITGFSLGFGTRFQSLESSRDLLAMSCDFIQTRIIRISRPFQLYLTRRENREFNARYIQLRNEVMNLMLARTLVIRNAMVNPLSRPRKTSEIGKFFSGVNRWFRKNVLASSDSEKEKPAEDDVNEFEPVLMRASEEAKLCFPKLGAELTALEEEANETRERINSLKTEITNRKEQKGDFYNRKNKELSDQETRIRNYDKAITNREKIHNNKLGSQRNFFVIFRQKIVEGFELGQWFSLKNPTGTTVPDIDS